MKLLTLGAMLGAACILAYRWRMELTAGERAEAYLDRMMAARNGAGYQ